MENPFSNDDVTMEVLSRLSAKDLFASKCVSRGWNSLISNPSFLRIYSQRSKEISGFLIQYDIQKQLYICSYQPATISIGEGYPYMPLEFLPEKVILMASSNGLLCCRSCIYPGAGEYLPSKKLVIYVCNPITKEWIAILRPTGSGCHVGDTIGFAFYPFGCSSSSNSNTTTTTPSFKLVSVQRSESNPNTYSFVVYLSETQRWTISEEVCHCNYEIIDKNRQIFVGQWFHWLTMEKHVMTFDVEREVSGVIKLPGPMIEEERTCLGGCEGYLHYVCLHSTEFKVWMLKDYSNPKWVLKYHLTVFNFYKEQSATLGGDTLELCSGKIYKFDGRLTECLLTPLAFYEDVLYMYLDEWVYSYNFKTRTLKRVFWLYIEESMPTVDPYSVCLAAAGVLKECTKRRKA